MVEEKLEKKLEKIRRESIKEIEEGTALTEEEIEEKKKKIIEETKGEEGGVEKEFEDWKKETGKEN